MPLILPPAAPSPTTDLVFTWVDPAGSVHAISGNASGVNVELGERGLGLPEFSLLEEKLPFAAGTLARQGIIAARTITLPLFLSAATPLDLQTLIDDMYTWFATADETSHTPGYLRIQRRDGTTRQIACYYVGGLEGDLEPTNAGDTWQSVAITLRAPDPWATDTFDSTDSYDSSDFGVPKSIINAGQLDAYPVWTLVGPMTNIDLVSATQNKSLTLTADGGLTLLLGDTVVIDTRQSPPRETLQIYNLDTGVSHYAKLTVNSEFWLFVSGSNIFTLNISGATVDSRVDVRWLQRYRGVMR